MKKLGLKMMLCCAMLTGSAGVAVADTIGNVSIDGLGSHDGQVFYLNLGGQPVENQCSIFYCAVTNPNCNNMYAIALLAKAKNKVLSRVDFFRQGNQPGACDLWLLEVN